VASERLAVFASMPTECAPYERELPGTGTVTVRHAAADAPSLGDEAVALVHEAALPDGTTVLRDIVGVRIGAALILTEGPDVAADSPELGAARQQLRELTARAVEEAAAALPA